MSKTSTVFISYRRDDSQAWAGRIADFIRSNSSAEVILDVSSIKRGDDYTLSISAAIDRSDLVLVVIGKTWLTCSDEQGRRRLDLPNDPVRFEVEHALADAAGRRRVIPVFVEGASMPDTDELPEAISQLSFRHGMSIDHESFERDLTELINDDIGPAKPSRGKARKSTTVSGGRIKRFLFGGRWRWLRPVLLAFLLLLCYGGYIGYSTDSDVETAWSNFRTAVSHRNWGEACDQTTPQWQKGMVDGYKKIATGTVCGGTLTQVSLLYDALASQDTDRICAIKAVRDSIATGSKVSSASTLGGCATYLSNSSFRASWMKTFNTWKTRDWDSYWAAIVDGKFELLKASSGIASGLLVPSKPSPTAKTRVVKFVETDDGWRISGISN